MQKTESTINLRALDMERKDIYRAMKAIKRTAIEPLESKLAKSKVQFMRLHRRSQLLEQDAKFAMNGKTSFSSEDLELLESYDDNAHIAPPKPLVEKRKYRRRNVVKKTRVASKSVKSATKQRVVKKSSEKKSVSKPRKTTDKKKDVTPSSEE